MITATLSDCTVQVLDSWQVWLSPALNARTLVWYQVATTIRAPLISVSSRCVKVLIYHRSCQPPVTQSRFIRSGKLGHRWCPAAHTVRAQNFIYPPTDLYPVRTYFYITRAFQKTVQLCRRAGLQNCCRSKVFLSSVRVTNDSNDSFHAKTKPSWTDHSVRI